MLGKLAKFSPHRKSERGYMSFTFVVGNAVPMGFNTGYSCCPTTFESMGFKQNTRQAALSHDAEQPVLPVGSGNYWAVFGVCVFLACAVWLVFGQTLGYGFVDYDDNVYVYENPVVQKCLTWEGFHWALTYGQIGHWHPLTWLSHMLDCQLYGLHAGGHHLTNLLLHTATAILLFLVLREMTGALWRSAFVAAVFAIHPLRVESVAWVAERKDVLSAFFSC